MAILNFGNHSAYMNSLSNGFGMRPVSAGLHEIQWFRPDKVMQTSFSPDNLTYQLSQTQRVFDPSVGDYRWHETNMTLNIKGVENELGGLDVSRFSVALDKGFYIEFTGAFTMAHPSRLDLTEVPQITGMATSFIIKNYLTNEVYVSAQGVAIPVDSRTPPTEPELAVSVAKSMSGNDVITGSIESDYLMGYAGNDTILGGGGDDTLMGGSGRDMIDGGSGSDTALYWDMTRSIVVTLNGATNATVTVGGVADDTLRNIENVTGGSGADILTGDSLANTLIGNAGNDILNGMGGNDILMGGAGNDTLDGGAGVDTADYSDKTQSVVVTLSEMNPMIVTVGGIAEDTIRNIENLIGGSGADGLTGDSMANTLIGNAGNDMLNGMAGNDILRGGAGKDTLDGGTGVDTADYSDKTTSVVVTLQGAANATVMVGGVAEDTIRNIENLIGGSGADRLTGDALANTIRGGAGNDTLDGAGGIDTLDYSETNSSVVLKLDGANLAVVRVGDFEVDSVRNFENVIGGGAADTLIGDAQANRLVGNAGNDVLYGMEGNDVLSGGLGLDYLDGGAGVDTADYSEKTLSVAVTLNGDLHVNVKVGGVNEDSIRSIENITGGSGADILIGDALANTLIGNAGNDMLSGMGGNDILRGGAGKDTLDGGTGIDTADYSDKAAAVSVTLNGTTNATVFVGGVAEDTIRNIENVTGGSGADFLIGDGMANTLFGNAGDDVLNGMGGNDILRGGLGNDTLAGGAGQDIFRFDTALNAHSNVDHIIDFSVVDDTIQLSNSIFTKFGSTTKGTLNANFFKDLGFGAQDVDDYIVFDSSTGALYYDANGSTNGMSDAVQFATLTLLGSTQSVTHTDFMLI